MDEITLVPCLYQQYVFTYPDPDENKRYHILNSAGCVNIPNRKTSGLGLAILSTSSE